MNALFADTSYFLAILIPSDDAHDRAMDLSRTLHSPLVTTDWVIVEMGNFLSPRNARPLFDRWLTALRRDPRSTIVPAASDLLNDGIARFISRPDKEWSLTDCISFEVMERRGLTDALTTDHHFEQAGFRILLK